MRSCNCTGYLTNPGGRCCMDVKQLPYTTTTGTLTITPSPALTEADIRRIIREELHR